jgi:hypothetical protein
MGPCGFINGTRTPLKVTSLYAWKGGGFPPSRVGFPVSRENKQGSREYPMWIIPGFLLYICRVDEFYACSTPGVSVLSGGVVEPVPGFVP